MAAGRTATEMARLVVAHIDADHDVRRVADEPGVLFVISGARLSGDRLAELLLETGARSGAAQDYTFHHGGDLIGGHRIEHLLAPVDQRGLRLVRPFLGVATDAFALVVAIDGVAVTVLNAV